MNNLSDFLIDIMLAGQTVGVMMLLVGLLVIRANRGFFRHVWNDQSSFWRLMARISAIMVGSTLVWICLLDDWMQLVTEPYRLSQQWEYQRQIYNPVDPSIRAVSVILLAMALLSIAFLFARHVGGYGVQIGTLVAGVLLWIPAFLMNGRVNTLILQGAETAETLPQTLGLGAFWMVRIVLMLSTIVLTLIPIAMVMALVATFILNLLNLREPPITKEADGFFAELSQRSRQHEDIPLKYHWKPIRRPL